MMLVLAVVVNGAALGLILWQAKRDRVAALLSAVRPIGEPRWRPAGAGLPPQPVPVALVTSTSSYALGNSFPNGDVYGPQLIPGRRVSALGGGS